MGENIEQNNQGLGSLESSPIASVVFWGISKRNNFASNTQIHMHTRGPRDGRAGGTKSPGVPFRSKVSNRYLWLSSNEMELDTEASPRSSNESGRCDQSPNRPSLIVEEGRHSKPKGVVGTRAGT